jgi:hypothetical protein
MRQGLETMSTNILDRFKLDGAASDAGWRRVMAVNLDGIVTGADLVVDGGYCCW